MGENKNLPEISVEKTRMVNGLVQTKEWIKVTGMTEEACFKQFKKVKNER